MPNIVPIDFHGDAISTIKDEQTGKIYCLPREICFALGNNWPGQHAKLTQSKLYQKHISRMDIHTASGTQGTLLLDIDLLPSWLTSIALGKVKPAVQAKLLLYQEECAKALRDYWFTGQATNPRATALDQYPELKAIAEMALSLAQQRDEQARLRAEQERLQGEVGKAMDVAHLALKGQHWLTLRQYAFLYDLGHQFPTAKQKAFATFLTGYCLEKDIPMYKALTADRLWKDEKTYSLTAITETLPGWLRRYSNQLDFEDEE